MSADGSFAKPAAVAKIFAGYPGWWAIAGGWAIDLFLGKVTREHADVEVAVLRYEQAKLQSFFTGWDTKKVLPSTKSLERWESGEVLSLPVHELHARNTKGVEIELLLNETNNDGFWVFRRNNAVKQHFLHLRQENATGIPFLTPEIVLLYKATNPTISPNDTADFLNAKDRLQAYQKIGYGDLSSCAIRAMSGSSIFPELLPVGMHRQTVMGV